MPKRLVGGQIAYNSGQSPGRFAFLRRIVDSS
ncbi:MAG: hypothetical protein QOF59_581, partial [Actinomycetota bacterium]|nr:hypothetical protein [Actinomycetota bacterium]